MKHLKRQGWFKVAVPASHIESLADHSFGVAFLAYYLSLELLSDFPSLNPYKLATAALLHDLEESLFQDLDTSYSSCCPLLFDAFKNSAELFAKRRINSLHADFLSLRDNLSDIEKEIISIADVLDMAIQTVSYSPYLSPSSRSSFLDTVSLKIDRISHIPLKKLVRSLLNLLFQENGFSSFSADVSTTRT